jgi:hypothetical protein
MKLRVFFSLENRRKVIELLERFARGRYKCERLAVSNDLIVQAGFIPQQIGPPTIVGYRQVDIITVTFGQNATKEYDLIEMAFRMEMGITFLGRVSSRYQRVIG